jgi:hypothetical protein
VNVPGVIAIGILTLAALAMLIGWYELRRLTRTPPPAEPPPPPEPTGIERLYREPVVVTLKTGESFSGVLFEQNDHDIVLRNAHGLQMASDGRDNLPIDGEVLIFVRDIAYMQKP